MRQLTLVAALLGASGPIIARGDTLATLNASQVATGNLDACFDRNFQPGRDKANDHGLSKRRLLGVCSAEWDAAAQACHNNSGDPIRDCRTQTGQLADDYLNLKSASIR